MFRAGVTSHLKASFEDLSLCPESGKVRCGDQLFDCVLGSRMVHIFRPNRTPQSPLPSQLKQSFPGKQAFAKGRLYQTRDGKLCNATELGAIGHGVLGEDESGETTLLDAQWLDTHSHASVVHTSPNIVKYLFIKAALTANGCRDAAADVHARYLESRMPERLYNEAASRLKDAHRQFHETLIYCRFCTSYAAGNALRFATAFDRVETAAARDAFVRTNGGPLSDPSSCGSQYFDGLRQIPPFMPQSREDYYGDCIDFTTDEIHDIWGNVCEDIAAGRTGSKMHVCRR
ncbi:hypothetical protein CDD83_6607 [Cordyceps sp. RAO-2017]|nr:hypothetical protein CDD83_6607 [Cordyceps sp. RAO-2017]